MVLATEGLSTISKQLGIEYGYVETDEEIGPRVKAFEHSEEQLRLIGQQLIVMRDAASATHEAHLQLVALAAEPNGAPTIPSVRTFGARQNDCAQQTQSLAAHYDRFVNLSVNQLEGLAGVVSNKYKAYTGKVVEMRRRKAQLQLLVRQKERSDLRTLERSLIPPGGAAATAAFQTDLEGKLVKQSMTTGMWWLS